MSALPQQLERVVLTLCDDIGTERALLVAKLVKERRYGELVNLTIDPNAYRTAEAYFLDAVPTELLRKYSGFKIEGIDKAAVAHENFVLCERACASTNARLSPFLHNGPFEDPMELRLFESIERMQRWIAKVLGSIPSELFDSRFGPGATFRDVGKYITVPDKITSRPTIVSEACALLPLWDRTAWARARLSQTQDPYYPEIVRGNRFTTVPKDAKKDRGIAIEPSINVYFQLGVGSALKRRLKSVGLDLEDGQDTHRLKACEASRGGELATVDLSNASDTVSYNLVKLLLPKGWFDLVDTLRSPMTLVNDRWHHLEKFSSMGNGFTFELETLLFAAIASEACYLSNVQPVTGSNLFVFGDDIILPVKAERAMSVLLKYFGFTPNPNKTFFKGPFRESCGGDFFEGVAVRPHYLEDEPCEPHQWIALANGIRRLGRQDSGSDFRYSIFWRAWLRALDALPNNVRRLRGPIHLGDLVIHDLPEFWRVRWTPDRRRFIRTWMPFTKALPFHHWKEPVVFASALYGVGSDGPLPRDNVSGFRHKWVSCP